MITVGPHPAWRWKGLWGLFPPPRHSRWPLPGVPGRVGGGICALGQVYLVAQDNRLAGSQRDCQAAEHDSEHQSGNATPRSGLGRTCWGRAMDVTTPGIQRRSQNKHTCVCACAHARACTHTHGPNAKLSSSSSSQMKIKV